MRSVGGLAFAFALLVFFALTAIPGAASSGSSRVRDGMIAFVRGGALYVVAPDRRGLHKLAMLPRRGGFVADGPAWSPDGRRLAFGAHFPPETLDEDDLIVRAPDGKTNIVGDAGHGEVGVSWSPDGKRLVIGSGGDDPALSFVDVAAKRSSSLRRSGGTHGEAEGFDPAWSRDGRIAYRFGKGALCRAGNCTLALRGIALISPEGRGYRQLTSLGGDPAWSPDGKSIAFTELSRPGDIFTEMQGDGERGIAVVRRDGSHLTTLTSQRGDRDPAWSPSGAFIVFTRGSQDSPSLWIMHADGSGHHLLIRNGEKAAWQPLPG